jgi:hypothetical protein
MSDGKDGENKEERRGRIETEKPAAMAIGEGRAAVARGKECLWILRGAEWQSGRKSRW